MSARPHRALPRLRASLAAGLLATSVGLVAAAVTPAAAGVGRGESAPAWTLPPLGTDVDYQLGGAAAVPDHVGIVVRDRTEAALEGTYGVCYVNGFQAQPDQKRFWLQRHPRLVLRDDRGRPVVDSAWGEFLLDTGTPRTRTRLAAIMGRWTRGCADDGYQGVEYDNLDSFTRSRHLLRRKDNLAFAALLVAAAHDSGLAAGQKNLAGYDGTSIGYDFAVAEECGRWKECDAYAEDFGDQVLAIEYRAKDFKRTCTQQGDVWAVVLRDLDLTPDGVHRWC